MVNGWNGAIRRRPVFFFLGLLTGAAAVGAYTLSCNAIAPATSGPDVRLASDIAYANGRSGLGATTVQAALDEIGTTMRAATSTVVTGGGPDGTGAVGAGVPTVWAIEGRNLDATSETWTVGAFGTVTFTETAPGQGTYQTSDANVFMLDGVLGTNQGLMHTGLYFIYGDTMIITGETAPGHKGVSNWPVHLSNAGGTMTLVGGSVVLVLTKQ
jgi:hypothetical protein